MQQYDHVVMYLSLKVKITLHSRQVFKPSKLASEMKKKQNYYTKMFKQQCLANK